MIWYLFFPSSIQSSLWKYLLLNCMIDLSFVLAKYVSKMHLVLYDNGKEETPHESITYDKKCGQNCLLYQVYCKL